MGNLLKPAQHLFRRPSIATNIHIKNTYLKALRVAWLTAQRERVVETCGKWRRRSAKEIERGNRLLPPFTTAWSTASIIRSSKREKKLIFIILGKKKLICWFTCASSLGKRARKKVQSTVEKSLAFPAEQFFFCCRKKRANTQKCAINLHSERAPVLFFQLIWSSQTSLLKHGIFCIDHSRVCALCFFEGWQILSSELQLAKGRNFLISIEKT